MFGLLIILQVTLGSVLMANNNMICRDSFLHRVSLYNINGSSTSGIPLFKLKKDLTTFHAMCFPNSTAEQLVSLSLEICKQLGYDALQRSFSVDAHLYSNTFHKSGMQLDVNCIKQKPELQCCQWQSFKKMSCQLYLGVNCTGCNYVLEIKDGMKQELEFPAYLPCLPNTHCGWNILNSNKNLKKTVLQFITQNVDSALIPSSSDNTRLILEVQWFDVGNSRWTMIRESLSKIGNMGPIKIDSNNITVHYYFEDCPFPDYVSSTQGNTASLKYYGEGIESGITDGTNLFVSVAFCLLFVVLLFACICCYVRKREQGYTKHLYTLSYTPGLDITYEEDGKKTTEMWQDVYQQPSPVEQNTNLSFVSYGTDNSRIVGDSEVSKCDNINPPQIISATHSFPQNDSRINHRRLFSSLGGSLLSCFIRKSPDLSAQISKSLSLSNVNSELDDSTSFQHRFEKFDSLILNFLPSDSTDSVNSDSMVLKSGSYLTHLNQLVSASSNKTLDFLSGQLLLDTKISCAEPMRNLATQLATQYRKSTLDLHKCASDEELFSCSSGDSVHSYHSVYPFTRTSITCSDSFISVNSDP